MKNSAAFNRISWGATLLVVFALVGYTTWRIFPEKFAPAPTPTPTFAPTSENISIIVTEAPEPTLAMDAIVRGISLKTDLSKRVNYKLGEYTVVSGDALFSIAKQFNIKPETLLWANSDVLKDNPDNLVPGQELVVPPTDGVYYKVKDGDTLEAVATEFKAKVEDIIDWPGNDIDLANPTLAPGSFVMVPGGQRELVDWIKPVVARGRSGTAGLGGANCDGPIGSGAFIWPTGGSHVLSGYEFSSSHLGIDIAAGLGTPVLASDAGVVVTAGWSNSGYGNVIMIDHGNGYQTVYGHLSVISVSLCQGVSRGQVIGAAGSTGNSSGPHLHFEVRLNGGFVNPWSVIN